MPELLDAAQPEREILTWDLFGAAIRQLAQQVADSGFIPDLVLGIARGGLPIADGLAYALGAKALGTVNGCSVLVVARPR